MNEADLPYLNPQHFSPRLLAPLSPTRLTNSFFTNHQHHSTKMDASSDEKSAAVGAKGIHKNVNDSEFYAADQEIRTSG
jgi:hypothetical protein